MDMDSEDYLNYLMPKWSTLTLEQRRAIVHLLALDATTFEFFCIGIDACYEKQHAKRIKERRGNVLFVDFKKS